MKWKEAKFYRGNIEELKLIMKDLNMMEKVVLFSIFPYVNYSECCIVHCNGRDIGTSDLNKITGLSKSVFYKTVNSLCEKNILHKVRHRARGGYLKRFYINPWLVSKGDKIDVALKHMFENYIVRTKGNKPWKELGNGLKKCKSQEA